MKNYIELLIQNISEAKSEMLVALLENIGFSGFEEDDDSLKAFINETDFDEQIIKDFAQQFSFSYSLQAIKEQNWNALWESNFEPVVVDDFVTVRAHFHQPNQSTKQEILITPKMSFGTGHHATTFMMIQQMRDLDFGNKSVFDFGTGTGVLAILAEKLGAKNIVAIDNDDWSIENAKENIIVNNASKIIIAKAENAASENKFDVVLANINKNVILDNADILNNILKDANSSLLLSGLLATDEDEIIQKFTAYDLRHSNTKHRAQWISVLFNRK